MVLLSDTLTLGHPLRVGSRFNPLTPSVDLYFGQNTSWKFGQFCCVLFRENMIFWLELVTPLYFRPSPLWRDWRHYSRYRSDDFPLFDLLALEYCPTLMHPINLKGFISNKSPWAFFQTPSILDSERCVNNISCYQESLISQTNRRKILHKFTVSNCLYFKHDYEYQIL